MTTIHTHTVAKKRLIAVFDQFCTKIFVRQRDEKRVAKLDYSLNFEALLQRGDKDQKKKYTTEIDL